ncbi:hypothetical protein CUMW_288290, partial [Citrus unshiu]
MVGKGIPYFPLLNSPCRKGKKHRTTYVLQKNSPSPVPCPPCASNPSKAMANAETCTNRIVVPGMKTGDSSKIILSSVFANNHSRNPWADETF